MIGHAIAWFIWAGMTETRAIALASNQKLWRALQMAGVLCLIIFSGWYLIGVIGDMREASIAAKWNTKFTAVEKETNRLQYDRSNFDKIIDARVQAALDSIPPTDTQPLPPPVAEPELPTLATVPVQQCPKIRCAISVQSVRALNAIRD